MRWRLRIAFVSPERRGARILWVGPSDGAQSSVTRYTGILATFRYVLSIAPYFRESAVKGSAVVHTIAGFAFVAIVPALVAQAGPPVRDLPKPVKEIEDPYSLVAGVREAAKGAVIVVDAGDGELTVVDFSTGERTPLGRQGSGPGEYRMPGAVWRMAGDTLWVLDAVQQRITAFLPDLKPGVPFHLQLFDTQTRTAMTVPFSTDLAGRMYASALPMGAGGPNVQIPDSVEVIRFDPRGTAARSAMTKVRFPTNGKTEMTVEGTVIRYKMAFPGLVTADSWAVFPDGRIAIVHGHNYTVEFIAADGKRATSAPIAYERIPVTKADQEFELAEAKRVSAEQIRAAQRAMPAGFTLDFTMTPPESWPSSYPAISPMQVFAAPDGLLWIMRATPAALDRQRWDVVDGAGVLVARWQLPKRTRVVGVGVGVVYTVRLDEDDLQYLQRVEVRR